jgi:hypothetical protein
MELLQVCGPLLMVIILQFSLCLHELLWLMISVDDCLLPKNVMSPLAEGLYNGVHFFVVSRVLRDSVGTGEDAWFNASTMHQQNPNYWPFWQHLRKHKVVFFFISFGQSDYNT